MKSDPTDDLKDSFPNSNQSQNNLWGINSRKPPGWMFEPQTRFRFPGLRTPACCIICQNLIKCYSLYTNCNPYKQHFKKKIWVTQVQLLIFYWKFQFYLFSIQLKINANSIHNLKSCQLFLVKCTEYTRYRVQVNIFPLNPQSKQPIQIKMIIII